MHTFQRHIAITIGINQYDHGIAPLQTAVQDAQTLAAQLKDDHHYQVTELVDEAATLAGLSTLFCETLPQLVTDQDCLLIYFAGHGIAKEPNRENGQTNSQTEGPVGYLIPQDARPEDEGTFLPMQEMYRALEQLPCRHFLLILDCCFAGAFRWASTRDVLVPEKMYKERFERFQTCAAWQVLTSASHDQKALDILRDNRGMVHCDGDHSPFAAALFEALTGKDADYTKDNVITATELYLYLRNFVETRSKEKQTPGLWPLPKHDRGEFFFLTQDFKEEKLPGAPTLDPDNNPYRGLEAYEERHGNLFFGRDQLIKSLYTDHIKTDSLTVVVGASGTGKSSLVKAGVIPYLKNESFLQRRQEFKDKTAQVAETWQVLPILRPGNDPLAALAQMLLPSTSEPLQARVTTALAAFDTVVNMRQAALPAAFHKKWQALEHAPKARLVLVLDWNKVLQNRLTQNHQATTEADLAKLETLTEAASSCVRSLQAKFQTDDTLLNALLAPILQDEAQPHVLLVVDQAEELITQGRDEATRQRFLAYLERALATSPERFRCVLTVRIDFEPLVMQLFSRRWQEVWPTQLRLVVPPMNQDDLRQAIEGPANEAVLHFEPPSLLDELINEVVQMPGALPLLSFTLSELYIKCFDRFRHDGDLSRSLTQADYEDLGKVSGALRTRANQEFDALDEAGQRTLRNIMLRMVAFEGGELARRRVPRSELVYSEEEENQRVEAILNRLIEQRLVISGRTPEGEYVEPAHDILLRGWERMPEWLQAQPGISGAEQSSAITIAKAPTNTFEEQEKLLLQRRLTVAARDWRQHQKSRFLWHGNANLPKLKQIRQADPGWFNKVEAEFVHRSLGRKLFNIRLRWLLVTLAFLGISAFAGYTWLQERRTALRADALRVETLLEQEPVNALVLAIQTAGENRRLPLPMQKPVIYALLSAVQTSREKNVLHEESSRAAWISPDGELIAAFTKIGCPGSEMLQWWNRDGLPAPAPFAAADAPLQTLAFSPDNALIAAGDATGRVHLYDRQTQTMRWVYESHDQDIDKIVFSPDSQKLAVVDHQGTLRTFDIAENTASALAAINGDMLGFDQSSQSIISITPAGLIQAWNLQGQRIGDLFTVETSAPQTVFSIASDQSRTVIMGNNGSDRLTWWDLSGQVLGQNWEDISQIDYLSAVAANLVTNRIAFLTFNGAIQMQNLQADSVSDSLVGHYSFAQTGSLSFTADGQTLVSSSDGAEEGCGIGSVRVWDMQSDPIGHLISDTQTVSLPGEVIFNGQRWLTRNDGNAVHYWNLDTTPPIAADQTQAGVLSPNGQYLAQTDDQGRGQLSVWDVPSNRRIATFQAHSDTVNSIAFSADSQAVLTASSDGQVRFWTLMGQLKEEIIAPGILGIALSPDHKRSQQIIAGVAYVNTTDLDMKLRLYNWEGQLIAEGQQFSEILEPFLTFSPDGNLLLVSGRDTAQIWDRNLNPIGQPIRGNFLAFTADGDALVGFQEGQLMEWSLNWRDWLAIGCDRLRHHPVLQNPDNNSQKSAMQICERYVRAQD
jgi:WD40 repeat protein